MEDGFITVSTMSPPSSKFLYDESKLAFGCIVKPLMPNESIPTVTFPANEIVRCLQCKGYINPFCEFLEAGAKWSCNLCRTINPVPPEYFANLNSNGKRSDLDKRVELNQLSIDINAPESYISKPPMPCVYLFLIDISIKSQENDFLGIVINTLSTILASKVIPGYPRTEIALVFFDKNVHFVCLGSENVALCSVNDQTDLFLPWPTENMLVSIEDAEVKVEKALELVATLPSIPYSTGYKAALRACGLILQNQGGKIVSFCGDMLCESNSNLQFTFKQANNFYEELGKELAFWNISLSQYIKSTQFSNLQGLTSVSKMTGGQIYFYPNFNQRFSGEKLRNEIILGLTSLTAWECSLKFRHNAEWKILATYGNFTMRPDGLLGIPVYNYPFTYTFELYPTSISFQDLYLQVAMLYTNCDGERKLRIHNSKFTVTDNIKEVFKNANCDVLVNIICKKSLSMMFLLDNPIQGQFQLEAFAKSIIQNCVKIWGNQPANLEFFCASILGLLKHSVFQNTSFGCNYYIDNINYDIFSYYNFLFNSLGHAETGAMSYPRMYPIHEDFCRVLNLSYKSLESTGAYLLDTGIEMFIWVGKVYLWT